mgnify:CR=1 FL=1
MLPKSKGPNYYMVQRIAQALADEREVCAKVAEFHPGVMRQSEEIATAIRERR